jgi:hypothetical protein
MNPYVKFDYVFLAGSVLSRWFDWQALSTRLEIIRNDAADRDWPVGALCWWLRMVPGNWNKLGLSGVKGFGRSGDTPEPNSIVRNNFRKGGHSAALRPSYHEEIAKFVLEGAPAGIVVGDSTIWRTPGNLLVLVAMRVIALAIPTGYLWLLYLSSGLDSTWAVVGSAAALTVIFGAIMLLV